MEIYNMTLEELKQKNQFQNIINSSEYDFLREKPLGNNIILLGLGGSYAYGTNNENSDLENLLQFKIIDEANCIIESNLKLLKEYYLELIDIKKINKEEDQFFKIYYKICNYLIDIDDLIYFKIQYKEWFYFIKKNSVIKTESTLYKNLMFNPILFSAYHKDGIMNKLLSSKAQHKELEKIQIPMACQNKVNILMIFFQTFFFVF